MDAEETLRRFWLKRLLTMSAIQTGETITVRLTNRELTLSQYRRLATKLPHMAALIGKIAVAPLEVLEEITGKELLW